MSTNDGAANLEDKENIQALPSSSHSPDTKSDGNKRQAPAALDLGAENVESDSRGSSPRRMKDIHLDGSADNMPNVDPYMLDDKDLDIHSEAGGNAGSVYSDLSGRSWKSLRTPRTKPPSAASSLPRSSIASRARQIKDHEGEAFLSIDLMPQPSAVKSESRQAGQLRSSLRGSSCQTLASGISSTTASQRSGRNNGRPANVRVLSASSSYASPTKQMSKPNHHVKMPFKQVAGTKTSSKETTGGAPSQGLTERTAAATHMFHKILKEQKPTRTTYIQGRLLKARLKPLEPVQASGPNIHQCRGIVAETRSYGQSHSRTFQRWQAIMAGGATAHQHLHQQRHLVDTALKEAATATVNGAANPRDPRDLLRSGSVCESVHQTSQASSSPSPTPRDLLNLDEDDEGDLENVLFPTDPQHDRESVGEQEGGINTTYDGIDSDIIAAVEQRNMNAASLPESPAGPGHCDEDLTDLCGPDLRTPQASRLGLGPGERATPAEERDQVITSQAAHSDGVGGARDEAGLPLASGGVESYGNESVLSGSTSVQPSDKGYNSSFSMQAMMSGNIRRPQSASCPQKPVLSQTNSQRPKTAVDSSLRKAVRFADESKPPTQIVGVTKPEAVSPSKGKNSCRPHSLDSGFHDREDPEDDGQGKNKGSDTFLTERSVETPKGSTSQTSRSSNQKTTSVSSGGKKASTKSSSSKESTFSGQKKHLEPSSAKNVHVPLSLQEIYGVKPAALSYVNESNNKNAQEKQKKCFGKQGKGKKSSAADIKQKLDDRFAMYSSKKAAKTGEDITKKSPQTGAKQTTVETDVIPKTDDEEEREPIDKEAELRQVVGKFFKPADYSKPSQRPLRPHSAQSRKAKALKLLQAKTRVGSVRPFSATTYSDRDIVDKKLVSSKKNLRPQAADMFTEKTQILGKHGLLKSHSSDNVARHRPSSGSYILSAKPKDTAVSEPVGQEEYEKVEDSDVDETSWAPPSEARATCSASSRPKSGSRVTFASQDNYDDDLGKPAGSRLSSASKLRSNTNVSRCVKQRQDSALSQDSCRTMSSGFGDDGMIDADLMWRELPSDDSDDDKDNKGRDKKSMELVTEEDFFLAKFDLLDLEFEAARAELRQENLKSAMKQQQPVEYHHPRDRPCHAPSGSLVKHHHRAECERDIAVSSTIHNDHRQSLSAFPPHHGSSTQSFFLTRTGDICETENPAATKMTSTSSENQRTSEEPADCKKAVSYELETTAPIMAMHQRAELPGESTLSSHLYEKTGVYVEVSSPRKGRPGSASKARVSSCKADTIVESTQPDLQQGERISQEPVCIPGPVSPADDARVKDPAEELEIRKLETRRDLERDYPMLMGVKVKLQPSESSQAAADSGRSFHEDVTFGADNAGVIEENANQYGSYQDMLLAYRRHCMEGSGDSDSASEEDTYKRLARPKHVRGSQRKNRQSQGKHEGKTSTSTNKRGKPEMKPATQKTAPRPISATTNDSGWESDCQPGCLDIDESEGGTKPDSSSQVEERTKVDSCQADSNSSHTWGDHPSTETGVPHSPHDHGATDVHINHQEQAAVNEAANIEGSHGKTVGDRTEKKSPMGPKSNQGNRSVHRCPKEDVSTDKGTLEVVAHAKKFSKKPRDVPEEDPMGVLCQIPPLCFRLNARPPEGFLYYFAYGPNMSRDRLCTYLQCEKPPAKFWALLFGFGVVFNKKGTATDAASVGGFPNLEYNRASSVEGCIFQLTPAQLDRLDVFMDYPKSHEHVVLPVWMSNSTSSAPCEDLGVAQYCVPAVTYIAQNEATFTEPIAASQFAVSQCVKAATETCSDLYREHLASFSSTVDHVTPTLAITAA